jgi:hypothetical protein
MDSAVLQRAYWKNGKKNDLVLCYGKDWAYVFGWSKSDLVKEELQALLLENDVNTALVDRIEQVVMRDFEPYEWRQHADTPPRPVNGWVVFLAFILMAASQFGIWFAFHTNDIEK